ncbi:MAG: hypothetical protein CVU59_09710, partial [Deltaproteobacteria bacterium HGW-Deltaproteobacteria-17]
MDLVTRFGVDACEAGQTTAEDPGRYVYADGNRENAEIGRGGIGRVLLAFDRHLRREVAIKELHDDVVDETQIARFLREARVTGQLEHPGVVPVYELGHREDGQIYYGMRLVRGRTLRAALKACDGIDARLALLPHFVALCQTIAYAHSRGIVHRDIKPDNVMIGEFGETILLDWGLAGSRDSGPVDVKDNHHGKGSTPVFEGGASVIGEDLTQVGDFIGTPAYASPEQIMGDQEELTGGADIWSLGAVLYELVSGRPPFVASSVHVLIEQVLEAPVIPPCQLDPQIPAALSSVCVKALDRDPAARYADARDLAGEIEAFRAGRRVLAHEYTPWEHLVRFAVRKKGLLAAISGVLVVVVAALVLVSLSLRAEKVSREEAQAASAQAQAASAQAQAASARAEAARFEERRERLRAGLHFAQGAAEKAGRLLAERRLLSARIYAAAALVHNPAYPASPLADDRFAAGDPAAAGLVHARTLGQGRSRAGRTGALATRRNRREPARPSDPAAAGLGSARGAAAGAVRLRRRDPRRALGLGPGPRTRAQVRRPARPD